MATFHLSHFEINDDKHPLGRERVLYEPIYRFIARIRRWSTLCIHLILGNKNEKSLVFMHNRLDRQWRSLTTGNEKRIL